MSAQAKRDIFALAGLPPEVLAVAMAKYSRSKSSIKETIDELTEEKSAEFHEKWVLGYGDASVADMAIIAIACENVSILTSKAVEDTRLAAFQEKSTRYVDFDSTRYHRPEAIMSVHGDLYEKTIDNLFATYRGLLEKMITYMRKRFPKPEGKEDKMYESKLKARSLDAVRYLLPVATLTNFGMIMSARSLRHLISKLKGNPYQEIREIAESIQKSALEPAYNPQAKKINEPLSKISALSDSGKNLAEEISKLVSLQIKGAPTLIKHTDYPEYYKSSQTYLISTASEVMSGETINDAPRVDYIEQTSYEDELVTTLLYGACNYPYRQILNKVKNLSANKKEEIIDTVTSFRGDHDQPRREYEGGQFVFDILMDYGAFRDLQRHRMCTQINQPLSVDHGYEIPFEFVDAGLTDEFNKAINNALETYETLKKIYGPEADYVLPLACKKRTLFKMNLRELYHMIELRSKPGGHMSYRNIVVDMYKTIKEKHPMLVKGLRITTPNYDEDFFKR